MTAVLLPYVKMFLTKILSEPKVSKSLYILMSSIFLVRHCCFYENMWKHILCETNITRMRSKFCEFVKSKCEYDFSISDVSVRELLHFIFDAGSVVYNYNLQDRIVSIERLTHLKDEKTLCIYKFMHRKIVFVKVESSIIEISESFHWSRRCYAISLISVWNEIVLGSQGTVNQTTSC